MNNSLSKALRAVFAGTLMFVTCTNAMADGVVVHGSVYGGGNLADVKTNTEVNMAGGTVAGNVFGGGKGSDYNFTCDKAMVGTEAASNACEDPGSDVNKDKGTKVTISNGTIGTLEGDEGSQTLKEGTGNVYGGGEIGRVEWNTQVLIGVGTGEGTFAPTIYGSVFGAGKGLSTHGYSALVRGNSTVTVQGNAKVGYNVYGGGEISTVGRYWVKDIPADPCDGETKPTTPGDLPSGMPYQQRRGGICTVTIQGSAEIGYQGASDRKGHVFGAGKGVEPSFTADVTNRMVKTDDGGRLETFVNVTDALTGKTKTAEELYLEFLQTLALVTNTDVTINGSAKVKGSVYGGSESGFVQHDTNVKIQGSTCEIGTTNNFGNVFGGGKGLEEFAEAGKVKGNTEVAISAGSINGNVYGGGQRGITLGNVDVDITGGTVEQDVYGGGALADTNLGNWDVNGYVVATALNEGESITDLYERSGAGTAENPYKYTKITDSGTTFSSGTYYRQEATWAHTEGSAFYTTSVDLTGGTIKGDAYGGGLGQLGTNPVEAVVYGDITVTLGEDNSDSENPAQATKFHVTQYEGKTIMKSGRIFGCNNLNGSPQGDVTVRVWNTVPGNVTRTVITRNADTNEIESKAEPSTYEVAAVYGGGNLANYTATGKKTNVIIETCDVSIESVYGGGNAAAVPQTDVLVKGAYEIGTVFGGGNGKDQYTLDGGSNWITNPGANVNGKANTLLTGGYVHEAYGGSNEKGTITGDVTIDVGQGGCCDLDLGKLVGAGKNADVNGDLKLIMGCKPENKIPLVYGGADNANVNGDVELTITSGNFGKVIGGNNNGGVIKGHIILNIEETTCIPINIDELYGCGYNAAYSEYGYYVKTEETEVVNGNGIGAITETAVLKDGKLQLIPRESMNDSHLPVDTYSFDEAQNKWTWTTSPITGTGAFTPYDPPVLNVISCTSIGEVFGGGFGETATVYGNPTVNINMIPGAHASKIKRSGSSNAHDLGAIGSVYGGGDAAAVYGNTNVNIGTATEVPVYVFADNESGEYELQYENGAPKTHTENVEGAYITGNVYGGGKLADVTGNAFVNVCAEQVAVVENNEPTGEFTYNIVNFTGTDYQGVIIGGNVYGGGEGYAKMEEGTAGEAFLCAKAMIGVDGEGIEDSDNNGVADHPDGGTSVVIGNGTVTGNVYGGGMVGRVEKNTKVTIGIGEGTGNSSATSTPVVIGNVFGAGAGTNTHGYSALVRGTSTVLVEGDAKVLGSVYGGGEKASVGRYRVGDDGLPQVLNNALAPNSGYCYVTIRGFAEIGPDNMEMTKSGGPSDAGHVFGACQGVLPYQNYADNVKPQHMDGLRQDDGSWKDKLKEYTAYSSLGSDGEDSNYSKFIKSLALATQTLVTIEGNPFIKGSVYGGSENGYVQQDTRVVISGGQIGNGYVQMNDNGGYLTTKRAVNRRYTAKEWEVGRLFPASDPDYTTGTDTELENLVSTDYYTSSLPECASWPYGQAANANRYAPYDKFANQSGDLGKYENGKTTEGGRFVGDDGHTFFGNVFGGGSGYYPYRPGKWFKDAGAVYGDTYVMIKGGHILTSIYGGNEMTDVGKYDDNDRLKLLSGGNCYVTMIGGTLGVPRTLGQIDKHPVTCYLFGAGKGDQRVFFNKSTNVGNVFVHISDDARIYGSIFGGGEDGHVMKNVTMNIGGSTLPTAVSGNSVLSSVFTGVTLSGSKTVSEVDYPYIGTWGTSYVDGNVFGAGRGFGGDAYTAGNVAGTVTMNIYGGTMLGSIYGGGRLGSVGYGLFDEGVAGYGEMQDDYKREKYDGTLENNVSGFNRGYVYMTIGKDDGTGPTIGNTWEYVNVPTEITESGLAAWKTTNHVPNTEYETTTETITNEGNSTTLYHHRLKHTKGGNVFAGGMGRLTQLDGSTPITAVDWWKLGCVKSTMLTIKGGNIKSNVYGGGELGQVVKHHTTNNVNLGTEITIQGSNTAVPTIGTEIKDGDKTLYTFGSVFGGGYGSLMEKAIKGKSPKYIAGLVKEDTKIDMQDGKVKASIYGGGEMASVGESTTTEGTTTATGSTYVSVSGGTVGIAPITLSDNSKRYFGGAKMGNVYGGGSGHGNTVRSGKIFNSTNVTISDGIIYHNVYGGGAYGTVGDFAYSEQNETVTENGEQITVNKVSGISGLATKGTGVATVTITGGTIGYDGKENGMVFGSSRGDINEPGARDDYTAWVYDTHVTIGTSGSQTGPQINGTVYGSGENGHTYNNTVVTVNNGTIGIADSSNPGYTVTSNGKSYSGAEYPYRGNVYGGGCGTDKYYENHALETHDGNGQLFNSLAGIVYGTTTVNIYGGTVVRNVYGAGAMGSVGRTVTTTNSDNSTTTTYSGGSTTINVSGGVIGVSGTVGDGNVFGAARGDLSATGDYISQVRLTNVTVSGGTVKGNVYGGGELGDVGTIDKSDQTDYNYYWTDKDGSANIHGNNGISGTNNNTGICTVTVSGGTIGTDATTMNADGSFDNGNVFGGGKGSGSTWWCEKAIAYGTNVTVTAGTVKGSVYGGGEVGRVEDDAKVTIGSAPNDAPTINGSVFGAGKGLKTHGYSALVRGNAEVIVQGKSVVEGSVYGGGEIASVGKFTVPGGLPKDPLNGGTCTVKIKGNAKIGESGTTHHVYGACKGVTPAYNNTPDDPNRSKSMQLLKNAPQDASLWSHYNNDENSPFIWRYYASEADYLAFLRTLALTSNTHVTIGEKLTTDGTTETITPSLNAPAIYGSVYGGGERGITLGGVDVNMVGGTVYQDIYGGGSLADSNTSMWDAAQNKLVDFVVLPSLIPGTSATGYYTSQSANALITDPDATVQSGTIYYANYKTNVNLKGGTVECNVYGGGLGQLAKNAVEAQDEVPAQGTEGEPGYVPAVPAVPAQPAASAIEAKVYGDVSVVLNKPTTPGDNTTCGDCEVKGTIFGCNNLNGSPQAGVDVHIYKTVKKNDSGTVIAKPDKNTNNYEVTAVYGGGNLAAYYPDDETVRKAETTKAYVTIDGCELTSIGSVYGGGNAASVPATEVVVNGTYEIGEAFGGGNGKDDISYDGTNYVTNPGANVGLLAYPNAANDAYDTKENRENNYGYGIGKTHVTIYGGTVHKVFGGSNKRGNVRVEARTTLIEGEECEFNVGEAYGGGNDAPMDGDAILEAGCIPGLDIAYGGAANADVNGDVVLNITNGTYGRVFGGNDQGGVIRGTITVNIEETGCRPIVIGQLYGGGNLAAYSVDNIIQSREDINFDDPTADNYYKNYPKVNVKSFTSIGTIFGGGYGNPATLEGNPQVNINVYEGKYYKTFKGNDNVINDNAKVVGVHVKYPSDNDSQYGTGYPVPSHAKGAIGAINDVFGGGNEAKVIGNPTVNIGTEAGEKVYVAVEVKEGEELKGYCTRTGEGTTENPYQYSELTEGTAETTSTYYLKTVKAVDIRGNVFGGGNNAEVEGDTNVVIGKKITTP